MLLPQRFDVNEWFVLISLTVSLFIFLILSKGLQICLLLFYIIIIYHYK